MSKKLFILSIGLASFAVSCSSGSMKSSQFEDQRSTVVSSEVSSGEESGSSTVEEAGQSYLEIVNPVNCASRVIVDLENSNSLGDGTVDPAVLSDVKAAAAVLASARETAVRSLLGQNWPSIVAPDIEVLARDWSKAARAEFAISESVDLGAFNLAISGYRELLSNSQANPGFIRASLGIGPASETDMC
jgi:hypothetical protein